MSNKSLEEIKNQLEPTAENRPRPKTQAILRGVGPACERLATELEKLDFHFIGIPQMRVLRRDGQDFVELNVVLRVPIQAGGTPTNSGSSDSPTSFESS